MDELVKCTSCDGKGWYVLFHYRRECQTCLGTGEVEVEDPFAFDFDYAGEEFMAWGIPTEIDDDITEPLFRLTHTYG